MTRLAEIEADEWQRVSDARLAQQVHLDATNRKKGGLHGIRLKLGEPSELRFDPYDSILSQFQVVEALKRRSKELSSDGPRAALLYNFALHLETWR